MLSFLYRRLDPNALHDAGLNALDARRYRLARMIAAEARRRRNTMAYEIEARALWGLGRRSQAVDVLWKATRRYPTVHSLISAGRSDEATRLYAQVDPARLGDEIRERVASAVAQINAETRSE